MLREFLDAKWQHHLQTNPLEATLSGDHRWDATFDDASFAGVAAQQQERKIARQELGRLLQSSLSADARLNGELFAWWLDRNIGADRFCNECLAVSQNHGPYDVLEDLSEYAPPRTVKEAEDFLERMDKYPDYLTQHRSWLERGVQRKIVAPRAIVEKVPGMVRKHIPSKIEDSPIYQSFAKLPDSVPSPVRQRLLERAKHLLLTRIWPALLNFADYIEKIYLPKCRDTVGLSALPEGREWYRYSVLRFTTLPLDPDEVHQIGLAEVARITGEMDKVRLASGFAGTLAQYLEFLRSDPQFFYTDRQDLLRGYRDIAKRIDGELPRLFGKLPRLPYGVFPVPAHAEETAYTAYYTPGALSDGRSGRFYANTYKLPARPKWEMEALTLHEAVPGHHLQISLALELTDVPAFRKEIYIEAFGEGWGLYAESLGSELGLYRTPELQMGQLIYEMWRAVRLVVDTGLHWKGWTRPQTIAYFKANTGKSEHDIAIEVDRYIAWPGQALAYKIGQRHLVALRKEAQTALSSRFDIRRFHDVVLESGSLPLSMIDARVRKFIVEEQAVKQ